MAKGALFIGWGEVIATREQKAVQVFNETLQYYGSLQQRGQIDSFEPFLLEAHGGDLNGFALLRGDRDKLDSLRSTQEFNRMTSRAQLVVHNVGVIAAYTGDELQTFMTDFQQQNRELA